MTDKFPAVYDEFSLVFVNKISKNKLYDIGRTYKLWILIKNCSSTTTTKTVTINKIAK